MESLLLPSLLLPLLPMANIRPLRLQLNLLPNMSQLTADVTNTIGPAAIGLVVAVAMVRWSVVALSRSSSRLNPHLTGFVGQGKVPRKIRTRSFAVHYVILNGFFF